MKKHLFVATLFTVAVTFSATHTTQALPVVDTVAKTTNETVEKTTSAARAASDVAVTDKQDVQEKRQALEQKMAERKAAIAEKLSGQREEKCKQREATINSVLDNRVSAAERYFTKFQAIQKKLTTFATEKQLNIENAAALELVMNDSANTAQAALQAIQAIDFTCANASAAAPGALVKDQVVATKQALKDYRTAIKDYAAALKASVEQDKTTDTTTEETAQ